MSCSYEVNSLRREQLTLKGTPWPELLHFPEQLSQNLMNIISAFMAQTMQHIGFISPGRQAGRPETPADWLWACELALFRCTHYQLLQSGYGNYQQVASRLWDLLHALYYLTFRKRGGVCNKKTKTSVNLCQLFVSLLR